MFVDRRRIERVLRNSLHTVDDSHQAFYNIGFSEAKAMFKKKLARNWGHAIARGWAALLLDRLRDFAVAPSSVVGTLLLCMMLRAWTT